MSAPHPPSKTEKRLRFACVTTLAALTLMGVSLVYPKPLAVIVAMSVAQLLGTLSLAFFLIVVAADFRRSRILDREANAPISARDPKEAKATPADVASRKDGES
jgi:hypothetical protein